MVDKEVYIKLFGKSWTEALGQEYLDSKAFSNLAYRIAKERETKTIYPSRENVFRCFRETPYDKIKICLISQDPYPTESYADGLAFSNSLSKDISPTLKIILKEVDNCYPENIGRIDYGRLDLQNLSRWSAQGILLLNVALTIEKGKVGSHLELWREFTIEVFKTLNKRNDIILCLLGKEAKSYSKLINNPTITLLEYSHPNIHLYGGEGFLNKQMFKAINWELNVRNLKEIVF